MLPSTRAGDDVVQEEGLRDRGARRKPTCGKAARFYWERLVPLPQRDEAHARQMAAHRTRSAYLPVAIA